MSIIRPINASVKGAMPRLRVLNATASGLIANGGSTQSFYHEYGMSLVQVALQTINGSALQASSTVTVYGSLNDQDYDQLTTITITANGTQSRAANHSTLSGVWPYLIVTATNIGANAQMGVWAQPVAGNLN